MAKKLLKSPKTGQDKARLLLVDDHPVLRDGVTQRINREPDLTVCAEAGTIPEAMKAIGTLKPDMVILDISLKESNGIELIKDAKTQYPSLPILVFSMYDEFLYSERVLRAGARGYIMKQEPSERLICAIRQVLCGEIYVSQEMTKRVLSTLAGHKPDKITSPIERLSDRELEVFQLIGMGRSTREIAKTLCLSVKTVASHREKVKQKLNLSTGAELVRHAISWVEP